MNTTTLSKEDLKQCFIACFRHADAGNWMSDEEYTLILDLWMSAGRAGRAKMLADWSGNHDDWTVTRVQPVARPHLLGEPSWNVFIEYRGTGQMNWTHITGTEILAWQMQRAQIRDAQKALITVLKARAAL